MRETIKTKKLFQNYQLCIPRLRFLHKNTGRKEDNHMKIIRKGHDIAKELKKATECGNFVATPQGVGFCCNKSNPGHCCNS